MLRLLCTGDLHLGRHPTRVSGRDRSLSVETVWDAIVDYAVDQSVDAVVLTGDVVDQENRFYESVGPLQRGLEDLATAGIEVFAVSGNHDWDVLPNLADTIDADGFHLLGRGGEWEVAALERGGAPALQFVGWSYPRQHQNTSPLDQHDFPAVLPDSSDAPIVGLLHADVDQRDSNYAPVSSRALGSAPVDTWCLGHIHSPSERTVDGIPCLYPGSPQPLDPTETGTHGPWLVEFAPGEGVECTMVPLATLRYDQLEIEIDDVENEPDFRAILTASVNDALDALDAGREQLERVVFRVRCTGRTNRSRELDRFARRASDEFRVKRNHLTATLDRVDVETRPEIDLDRLVDGEDPPAELARLLIALRDEAPSEEIESVTAQIREAVDQIRRANAYSPLLQTERHGEPASDDEIRELLYRQGIRLLEQLLAQDRTGAEERDA